MKKYIHRTKCMNTLYIALKNAICGIVDHAFRTRVYCQTMVSSFSSHQGQFAYLGFVAELLEFHQIHCYTDRNGIVHHARRTRAHCETMSSNLKLSSGTVCLARFCHFYECSNASGRSSQILRFFSL